MYMDFAEYRYSRWDGSQHVFPFDADEVMKALADELMENGDLRKALERMYRWGDEGRLNNRLAGMRNMMDRLRAERQKTLQRHDMNSIMDDIKERLDKIIQHERAGIDQKLAEAGLKQPYTDQQDRGGQYSDDNSDQSGDQQDSQNGSPDGEGGQQQRQQGQQGQRGQTSRMSQRGQSGQQGQQGQRGQRSQQGQQGQNEQGQEGTEGQQGSQAHDGSEGSGGMDPALQKMLEGIASKKQQYLDNLPGDVPGQIKSLSEYDFMDPGARQEFQELMAMLQQQVMQSHFQGMQQSIQSMTPEDMARMKAMVRDLNQMLEDRLQGREPNFDEFMQKYGDYFPPGINNLDELLEHLAQRMAQMQSLMNSMSPEQRDQLQQMMDQLIGDDKLRVDLARLAANLSQLMPMDEMIQRYRFSGDEPMSLTEAMAQMERLQQMDQLEAQIRDAQQGQGIDQLDPERIGDLLGPEARHEMEALQELAKMLEEAGYIKKNEDDDEWEITPSGIRKIGQKALQDVFSHLKRDSFGKHNIEVRGIGGERIDESKHYEFGDPFFLDIGKTLMNSVARDGKQSPVHLEPADFEVYRTELLTQSATVLMLDMSSSMFSNDCFTAAKKVAMALNGLIKGQFPRDILHIVGFNMLAQEIKVEDLPAIGWRYGSQGTNLHHALMLGRRLLARSKCRNKQIIVITDGEPTAHLEPNGVPYFDYPPSSRTIRETLREVNLCTKDGVVINTFMLEMRPDLMAFINQLTKINKGRAFFSAPDQLGEYILVDYVNNKRKKVS